MDSRVTGAVKGSSTGVQKHVCNYRAMPETVEQPFAVRATAFIRPSRWLHHPVRLVRYDAYWSDGRVDFDVSLTKMMYRGYPPDFAPIDESVHAHCPEVGTGRWVGQHGGVVEGPTQPEPNRTRQQTTEGGRGSIGPQNGGLTRRRTRRGVSAAE